MTRRLLLTGIAALAPVSLAIAHGGHGADIEGRSVSHYLSEPRHVLPIVCTIVLLCVTASGLRRLRSRSAARRVPARLQNDQAS